MFQKSLGKVSRLSLKRKVPDGNGLKNCSNYHETTDTIGESKGINCIGNQD